MSIHLANVIAVAADHDGDSQADDDADARNQRARGTDSGIERDLNTQQKQQQQGHINRHVILA